MKLLVLFIVLSLCLPCWAEESITWQLTERDMEKLNNGMYAHKWRGESGEFMDEIRPPEDKTCLACNGTGKIPYKHFEQCAEKETK